MSTFNLIGHIILLLIFIVLIAMNDIAKYNNRKRNQRLLQHINIIKHFGKYDRLYETKESLKIEDNTSSDVDYTTHKIEYKEFNKHIDLYN